MSAEAARAKAWRRLGGRKVGSRRGGAGPRLDVIRNMYLRASMCNMYLCIYIAYTYVDVSVSRYICSRPGGTLVQPATHGVTCPGRVAARLSRRHTHIREGRERAAGGRAWGWGEAGVAMRHV